MPKLANSTVEVRPLPHCHTAKFPCWKRKGPMEPTSHQRKLMDHSNKINKSYQIIYPEFNAFHAFHGCGPDIGLSNHEAIRDHHTFEVCCGWIHPLPSCCSMVLCQGTCNANISLGRLVLSDSSWNTSWFQLTLSVHSSYPSFPFGRVWNRRGQSFYELLQGSRLPSHQHGHKPILSPLDR